VGRVSNENAGGASSSSLDGAAPNPKPRLAALRAQPYCVSGAAGSDS
jgi:hypothetical protein